LAAVAELIRRLFAFSPKQKVQCEGDSRWTGG
jgi:hypothetical protein